jgi:hypothetical protein
MRLSKKASLAGLALVLPFTWMPWALAFSSTESEAKRDICLASSAYAPFADLPQGLVLAPIDYGSHLLAFTSHSVLAAPYHRNNHGNRLALDTLLGAPNEALARIRESGATYVAVCTASETSGAPKRKTLEEALISGNVPDWLTDVGGANRPFRIFAVNP